MIKRILYILAIALSILACTDERDKINRFTFTGETVADFLLNRSDRYSHMITLMKRAELFGLLATWGQYTLFLPDNDAIEKFVAEQDSIYHATKDTERPIYTGITSPLVDELSDSMANVIARMHLIERNYRTADMGEGALGKWNCNDRAVIVSYKIIDECFYIMLNNSAAIIGGDNDVENGIIHLVDKPIDPQYKIISKQISEHRFFSIFNSAMAETGYADEVSQTSDISYIQGEDKHHTPNFTPKQKYYKYTAFIEPDEVFNANGIYTIDDLKAFAEKWYGTEDRDNPQSPDNALYKFVAYHFVEGEIPYNRIVYSKSGTTSDFDLTYIPGHDLYNYYTTKQGTLIKALKPLSTTDGLNIYLNYSKRNIPYNPEMRKHTNVRVIELTEFTQMDETYKNFQPNAGNGIIHPIDKILIYNEDEMVGNILDERMRFDIASLQPELSSNNIWQNSKAEIPVGYCKGIKTYNGECSGDYYPSGSMHMGDHMILWDNYDHAFLLPPVPARTYEIRISVIGGALNSNNRTSAKIQTYLDDRICGSPIPKHPIPSDPEIGWIADAETYDNGIENDKQMRNRGWMKAPDTYGTKYNSQEVSAREDPRCLRKIIHRLYLGAGEHWLRFRDIPAENWETYQSSVIYLDYIELVPLHIVSDPTKPEDRH